MTSLLKGFFCAFCKVLNSIHKQCIFIILKIANFKFIVISSHSVISVAANREKQYLKNILVIPPVMLLSTAHSYEHTGPAQTLAIQPSPKCQPSQTLFSFQNQMWSGM